MSRRLFPVLVLGLLVGVMAGIRAGSLPVTAQDDPAPDCRATPDNARCLAFSNVSFVDRPRALSVYPSFRNPLIEVYVRLTSPESDATTAYLYLDEVQQWGVPGPDQAHCEIVLVGLAKPDEGICRRQIELPWAADQPQRIHLCGFCKKINLPTEGERPPGVLPFPKQGTEIQYGQKPQSVGSAAELTALDRLVDKLLNGQCRNSLSGEQITMESFAAQLAVFLIFHDTATEGASDTSDAWQKFKEGGQARIDDLRGDFFDCLLSDTTVAPPIPTPTSTPPPTATPVDPSLLPTATATPVPLLDTTVSDNAVLGESLGEVLVRIVGLIVVAVLVILLLTVRRARLTLLVLLILVGVLVLVYLWLWGG
ncbi:MAG: hypothetical protein JXQ72_17490 [Anaerolineae bacterium]|nr:hypothetical protein [Anaerolineae bacterium]